MYIYILVCPIHICIYNNSLVQSWMGIAWSRTLRLFLNYLSENYFKTILKLFIKNIHILNVLCIPVSIIKFFDYRLNPPWEVHHQLWNYITSWVVKLHYVLVINFHYSILKLQQKFFTIQNSVHKIANFLEIWALFESS